MGRNGYLIISANGNKHKFNVLNITVNAHVVQVWHSKMEIYELMRFYRNMICIYGRIALHYYWNAISKISV